MTGRGALGFDSATFGADFAALGLGALFGPRWFAWAGVVAAMAGVALVASVRQA